MIANVTLAPWSYPVLQDHARYKIIYGGRGSGKSWQIARCLLILMMQKKMRVLCAREIQRSIKESVLTLLQDQIKELGLWGWQPSKTGLIYGPTGSEFLFVGLWHNVESVQSMERIDICWVEEAQKVSDHSWKILIPTIRRAQSEIWISFNPELEDDPTAIRFLQNTPPNSIVLKVNWQDNPWLPEVLRQEAEHLRRTDPEEYYHVWEGQFWSRSDAQIYNKKWVIDEFTPGEDWHGPFHGIDFGFSTTPTCIGRQWIYNDRLYVEEAYGGLRIETVDLPAQLDRIPDSKGFVWRADSARPETISFLNNAGYTVVGAEKGPGSVEDGISYIRSFDQIVLHPRASIAVQQVRLYRYKTDKHTGDVLKQIEKKHDDWSDQCRYALEPVIKGRLGSMADVV